VATYAIGDIQGCFDTLTRLLQKIEFDEQHDRLWLVGDLVNRGAHSLEVLRWAKDLEDRVTAVLGNHDFHLLALAEGIRVAKSRDTLDGVLGAPDREELLDWLRCRPLVAREGSTLLVHAGLHPCWDVDQAESLAREVEHVLQSEKKRELLEAIYKDDSPLVWDERLTGMARLRVIASVMTTLRTCTADGAACEDFSGPPTLAPPGCMPWFEVPGRVSRASTVIFGHWAALGFRMQTGVVALDTGCVWGGYLTAIRLEDRAVYQEPALESR
jgi:bis(5'-nucleosyl)-tetraphosphatase (symmetrical)